MESLHSRKASSQEKIGSSTLRFVDVQDIHDGIMILRDGSLRIVLAVSSINFDLKSTDEQNVIVGQYQRFLNSLDFSVQIVVSSRKFNVTPYIELLKMKEAEQTNDLLKMQIEEYIDFIKQLTQVTNIMTKRFYVVVPFFPVEANKKSIFRALFFLMNPESVVTHKWEDFETYKSQLYQRVDHIIAGLSAIGLRTIPLDTKEMIEVLHNFYNPNLFASTIIRDIEGLEVQHF